MLKAAAHLELSLDRGLSERIPLDRDTVVVGGDGQCDVLVPSARISRPAFRLDRSSNGWQVEVLDASCGALLNGRMFLSMPLESGDVLLLDGMCLTFRSEDVEAPESKLIPLAGHPDLSSDTLGWQHNAYTRLVTTLSLNETAASFVKACAWACSPSAPRVVVFERSLEGWRTLANFYGRDGAPAITINDQIADTLRSAGRPLITKGAPTATEAHDICSGFIPIMTDSRLVAVAAFHCAPGECLDAGSVWALQRFAWLSAPLFYARTLRRELDLWLRGSVDVIISSIEAKDTYTRGHSERVSRFSLAIGEKLRLSEVQQRLLLMSGLCHDIGKIGVADAILKKPSLLSVDEYEEIKTHPVVGASIIERLPNAKEILGGVRSHHERFDGTGYPDNLVGEEIPLFGRIIAIADAYDAMISGRSYSGYMTPRQATDRLIEIGDCFDPDVLKAFVDAAEAGTMTLRTGTILSVG